MNRSWVGTALALGAMIAAGCDGGVTAPRGPDEGPIDIGSVLLLPDSITVTLADTMHTTVIVRDKSGTVIPNPQVVFLCRDAPGPSARRGCGFKLITLDSTSFVFGPGGYMEGIVEVVARSGGVSSNTMYVFLAFGDPDNPWDY